MSSRIMLSAPLLITCMVTGVRTAAADPSLVDDLKALKSTAWTIPSMTIMGEKLDPIIFFSDSNDASPLISIGARTSKNSEDEYGFFPFNMRLEERDGKRVIVAATSFDPKRAKLDGPPIIVHYMLKGDKLQLKFDQKVNIAAFPGALELSGEWTKQKTDK